MHKWASGVRKPVNLTVTVTTLCTLLFSLPGFSADLDQDFFSQLESQNERKKIDYELQEYLESDW